MDFEKLRERDWRGIERRKGGEGIGRRGRVGRRWGEGNGNWQGHIWPQTYLPHISLLLPGPSSFSRLFPASLPAQATSPLPDLYVLHRLLPVSPFFLPNFKSDPVSSDVETASFG